MALDPTQLRDVVEALLFSSDTPLKGRTLAEVIGNDVSANDVRKAVKELGDRYVEGGSAVTIAEIAGGYQLLTRSEFDSYVRKLFKSRQKARLSRAALETLAIIAYRQPLTRPQIEEVRGVDAGGVLHTLAERGLIKIAGRAEGPGRPLLYGTTPSFMEHFGLKSLGQLPRIDDVADELDRRLIAEDLAKELGGDSSEFDDAISAELDPPADVDDAQTEGVEADGVGAEAEVDDVQDDVRDTTVPSDERQDVAQSEAAEPTDQPLSA